MSTAITEQSRGGVCQVQSISLDIPALKSGGDIGVGDGDIRRIHPTVAAVAAAGGGQHDGVALVAVVQRIIDTSDGDRLIRIPVGGGEREGGRRDRAFAGGGTAHANRHVGGGLAAELDGERCRPSGFGGVAADAADGEACRLVIGVGDGDINRIQPAVAAVAAVGGGQHDGVALVAVVHRIIDASDGDRLIRIPVGGGEREGGRRDRAFGSVAAAHSNCHVGGWLGIELDCERCRPSGFGCVAADATDGEACRLVVGVGDGDIIRIQPAVAAVAAVGGCQHDGVALVAVVQRIIDASDSDRLIGIPVGGGEREGGRRDRSFAGVGTCLLYTSDAADE